MSYPRPYISGQHLWTTITTDAGTLAVLPTSGRTLHFDAACTNHIPAYAPTGEHGSTILDIGRGIKVRVSGNAEKVGGAWELSHLSVSRDIGGGVTANMEARAEALVHAMIWLWTSTHEGDIAQADDIARNNAARTLEEKIAKHESALLILRENLRACDEGEPYSQYPDLPTDRR